MNKALFVRYWKILSLCGCLLTLLYPLSALSQDNTKPDTGKSVGSAAPTPATSAPDLHEHWDLLPLKDNHLHAQKPLVGVVATYPDFTRELIRVQWRGGDPIDLYMIRPVAVKHPPVVLYLYGYPSETDRFISDKFCKTVTKNGFAAVGFVSALTGQRYHGRPMKEWFISELQESIGTSVHDVQMVLNYLAARDDLDMNRVGMYGQGSGGTIAILAAAVDPRIKALDVMDPWADWPDWLAKSPLVPEEERSNYLKADFLAKVAPLDPVQWLPQLKTRPLRIQETPFNALTIDIVSKRVEAALPAGAQVVQYHDVKDYSEKVSANGKMLDWLHTQLQPSASGMTAAEFLQKAVDAQKHERAQQ